MNKLIGWVLKFGSSVVGKLLIKIGMSTISKILETIYPILKDAIVIADSVNITALKYEYLSNEELKIKIKEINNIDITDKELKYFRDEDGIKGMFKYLVAINFTKNMMKKEGKDIADFVINLGIELIISSYK